MDAKIIDEDFRRATKDARSNWTQVERSLDQLMKSAKSNSQIQAQIRRLKYLTKKVSNLDEVEFHWDSMMALKTSAGKSSLKMKKLTVVLTDINATAEASANHLDQSDQIDKQIQPNDKRKRSADNSLLCDYCGHAAKNWNELLEHLKSYRQCFDHYRSRNRTICSLCDKPFRQVRKHVSDTMKRRVGLDSEKHDLHEKYFALFYKEDTKKKQTKKRAPPKPKITRQKSIPTLLDYFKSEPKDDDYIVELQSDDSSEDYAYFGDFLEDDKENDEQAVPDKASTPGLMFQPGTAPQPGPAFQLSPPSESGPQIQSDPSSQHVLPSEPDSQEEISTDSCDQDYYLPDANTPLLDIVQSMSDKTETKIEDPTEVTINVEDDATDKVHGPKIVSDKAQTIPPAARLPIKGTTKQVPKGKRPIPKVKASFSILSRDRPQQLIRVQNNSGLIAIPISSSTSEPFPKQIQLNGRSLNVIQLPSMINGMTVTTTPIPPISSATNGLQEPTIISLPDMNDVSNSFKLVNIPQNEQQITKFPVWEIPKNTKPSEQKSVSELLRVNR